MIKIERTKKNEIESEWIAIKRNLYIKKVKTKKKKEWNENKSWWQRSCSHISIANKNIKAAQAVLTV